MLLRNLPILISSSIYFTFLQFEGCILLAIQRGLKKFKQIEQSEIPIDAVRRISLF